MLNKQTVIGFYHMQGSQVFFFEIEFLLRAFDVVMNRNKNSYKLY